MNRPAPGPVYFLLVDDLAENLLALEGILRRDGLVLLNARSGREALEMLLLHDVALALIDVQMPGMDGFELAELMRGSERTRRVPIIFLTAGIPDQQRRFRGYEAGAVDFLTKPIEPHVLRSKAEVFYELRRERQEVARQRDELRVATAENARLLAEMRQKAEALREADRRKDEFLATLAHELRNPLAPLANAVQLLKLSPPPEVAIKAREMMERQLGHLVHLVDDLLDISRVTSGKIRLRLETVTISKVVDSAVEASRPTIEAGCHELTVRLPPEDVRLNADATRLAQVIGNLLTNAAKYTPSGGRVELSAERVDGELFVRVADNGVGIPEDMLPKVFELFTQVGRSLDRAQGGLGIGLALVKKLVELHGGAVEADSPGPGAGSTFTVRLPAHEEREASDETSTGSPASETAGGYRVLVVDDNHDAADSMALLLSHSGHRTRTANSGPAALQAANAFHPELVFLDIGLPGMNGYEVAGLLRSSKQSERAILVAVTGWGSEEDRRRSKEAGFDFHLTKPVDSAKLDGFFAEIAGKR